MAYQHSLDGETLGLPVGKVVCVGRNYAEHAKELNNPVPTSPILFIKPATAIVPFTGEILIPKEQGSCHHELEMSVLIGKTLTNATEQEVKDAILGFGLGLDLTLRDLQSKLKAKSHPWEIAKSFDGACPLSGFVPASVVTDPMDMPLQLSVNGAVRQQGTTADMITPLYSLISYMSRHFTLQPGDVVMTGTPAGVAALQEGDQLEATLGDVLSCAARVV
ncbi:MAG: fumarylacetoacetate hydrolase family protein [Ketobacter sp.]|nr:MAG: fumarylacetoacetate hydrolase family protein [Ketobacter sp.]